jgi:hypothetical protein
LNCAGGLRHCDRDSAHKHKQEDLNVAGNNGHLIKPLSLGAVDWQEKERQAQPGTSVAGPGNARKEIWLNGRDHLEGIPFNFSWGVHNSLGEWHTGRNSHSHSYPECLFFVGLDTANVNYFGAEVECCLGEEHEPYTFNEPTVVIAPPGLPHGPITTKRLFSPKGFGFFAADLGKVFDIAWTDGKRPAVEPVQSTGKYAHLVKSLKPGVITQRGKFNPSRLTPEQLAKREQMQKASGFKPGPGSPDHLTWMYGNDLGGINMNVAWGFCSQAGIWHRGVSAHAHPADEILMFLGMDTENADALGAEIEIDLGGEPYFFDRSSVVVCPAGLAHGPILTRWVEKPFAFLLINLAADLNTSFA